MHARVFLYVCICTDVSFLFLDMNAYECLLVLDCVGRSICLFLLTKCHSTSVLGHGNIGDTNDLCGIIIIWSLSDSVVASVKHREYAQLNNCNEFVLPFSSLYVVDFYFNLVVSGCRENVTQC